MISPVASSLVLSPGCMTDLEQKNHIFKRLEARKAVAYMILITKIGQ
jgi:hypothetical protein